MFRTILRTHWMWTRTLVAGISLVVFLMPAAAWRLGGGNSSLTVWSVADGLQALGPILAFLALLGAFVLAVYPWTIDAETKHVYPLSLPITWPHYVGMRFVAGAMTLVVPAVALYLGGRLAVSMIVLPPLLHSYAGALAVRWLLAAFVAYSVSFALQYLAGRRATVVALLIVLGIVGLFAGLELAGARSVGDAIGRFLFEFPGPLGVFSQRWVLIDV